MAHHHATAALSQQFVQEEINLLLLLPAPFSNLLFGFASSFYKLLERWMADANEFAWDCQTVTKDSLCVTRGGWDPSSRSMSSTWCELCAVCLMVQSLVMITGPCKLIHRTDNQAVALIIMNGSRHPHLHTEAVRLFQLCYAHGMQLRTQCVPREHNEQADVFSKSSHEDAWQ